MKSYARSLISKLVQRLMSERGSVEETDGDLLAQQAYEEIAAEKEGREPKNLMPKPEEAGQEEEEKIEKPEEEETEEEESKPEEEGESEPETTEPEGEKTGEEEKDEDALITEHAQKYSMTYPEAKEDLEKTRKIIEQFKNDPQEMARALRNKDREYDKLRNEVEREKKATPVFDKLSESQFRVAAKAKIEEEPEKYVDAYRDRYPAKSENMSDEAIIEEVVDREWMGYQSFAKEKETELRTEANKRREDFLTKISDKDRRFFPDIKAMLYQLGDRDILIDDWNPEYLVHLAKGRKYDEDLKAAEERGAKNATEKPRILGVKTGGKQAPTTSGARSTSLTADQKSRAIEMFPLSDGYTPERAYELFKETFLEELKENPSFV